METADKWKLPWEAGCRCGQIRMRVTEPPLLASACHCTGCQRMSASAFSLTLTVPKTGFKVLSGTPVPGGLQAEVPHFHCPHCKSWVFTRPGDAFPFVNLRATMLDDASWFQPFIETWTNEKLPWATTGAARSLGTQPDYAEYEKLIADYQARGTRPR
ncbi:MAG TPA: GFA family protein [Polyangiales bacterium]|nr:GFA family protein [Polyangiales bacterium]